MMRLIDGDALVAKMNLAIAVLKRTMKNFDIEDDPECQMELKAYQDIRDGIKEEPTIEPEQKRGKWITQEFGSWAECSECHELYGIPISLSNFCPNCGAKMEE